MTQKEYPSGDDTSDDEEVGIAAITIAKLTYIVLISLCLSKLIQAHQPQCDLSHGSRYKGITSSHTHHTKKVYI
jgi:hypothetical protein